MRFGNFLVTRTGWVQTTLLILLTIVANAKSDVIRLGSAQEFFDMATAGQFDLIIDTRTAREWASGHIENATFVDSLQEKLQKTDDDETTLRGLNLWGCRFCRVAVYCVTGARAGVTLDLLEKAGFEGRLYNALGVSQWTMAGFPLVDDPSKNDWPCTTLADNNSVSRQSGVCSLQDVDAKPIIDLSTEDFYKIVTTDQIDLVIDTRTAGEWATGHIENATFIDSLQAQLSETKDYETALRELNLWGCRYCRVAVYCRSGRRSAEALDLLRKAGFEGQLYNGLGVNQWTQAGYPLVNDPSKEDWPCMTVDKPSLISRQAGICVQEEGFGYLEEEEFGYLEDGLGGEDYELHQLELNTAKDLFLAQMDIHNATDYSFQFTMSCFCLPADYPWLITAEMQKLMIGVKPNITDNMSPVMLANPVNSAVGDVVTSVITSTGEELNLAETSPYSILDLFDKIQLAIDQEAASIQVVYHTKWGYPQEIAVDYSKMIADEEFMTFVSDLSFVYPTPLDEGDGQNIEFHEEIADLEEAASKNFGW